MTRPLLPLGIASFMTVLLSAGTASAQVAPPPPPPSDAEPEYVPPPVPQPRPAQPVRPQRSPSESQANRQPRKVAPPPIPYEPLGSPDLEGNMPVYRSALDLPALKHNPTVPQSAAGRIEPVVQQRNARMEKRLIENLDLVRELEGGVVNEMLGEGVGGLVTLNTLIAPVVEEQALSMELFRAGALSDMQYAMNQKIINEYNNKRRTTIAKIQDKDEQLGAFMRMVMEESLVDVYSTHRLMALEMRTRMDRVLEKADLADSAQIESLRGLKVESLPEGEIERDALADEMLSALRELDTASEAALLAAVQETREDPEKSPLLVVDLDIHYKKDASNLNAADRIEMRRSGEVTKEGELSKREEARKARSAAQEAEREQGDAPEGDSDADSDANPDA